MSRVPSRMPGPAGQIGVVALPREVEGVGQRRTADGQGKRAVGSEPEEEPEAVRDLRRALKSVARNFPSLRALAREAGVSPDTVSRAVNGPGVPSAETLDRILSACPRRPVLADGRYDNNWRKLYRAATDSMQERTRRKRRAQSAAAAEAIDTVRVDQHLTDAANLSAHESSIRFVHHLSEATQRDCDAIAELASGHTLRLSTVYVARQLEADLLTTLGLPSLTAVSGEAGYGKTALLWNLHRRAAHAGYWPLLIPATVLLRGVEAGPGEGALTIDELWTALRGAQHRELRPVLLVDTLDLLTHSPPARIAVHRLLTTAAQVRLPMVVACRPTEAALLRLDENDNEEYGLRIRPFILGRFSETEVKRAIESYARACYPADEQAAVITTVREANIHGRALREVVANPLALRRLFVLYAPDPPDPDVDSIALYDLFWQWRVQTDRRDRSTPESGVDLSRPVELTALAMLERGRIDIARRELRDWVRATLLAGRDPIDLMRSRGVLVVREETQRLWFFHQTQFEHAAARAVTACGTQAAEKLTAFVADDPYDLLYGEVASQLLLLAGRTVGANVPADAAERLLATWLYTPQPGLRVLALRTYARFRSPSESLQSIAAPVIVNCDVRTGKDFLRLLPSVTHFRPSRWRHDLSYAWKRPELRLDCIEALIRLAARHPKDAVEFASDPENDVLGWLSERPIEQLRAHKSLYLRLLDALAPAEPGWCARQAMSFWDRFTDAPDTEGMTDRQVNVDGLTDVLCFLHRHGGHHADDLARIATTLQHLSSHDPTIELQRAYAALAAPALYAQRSLIAEFEEVLGASGFGDIWRQARMRTVATAALRLPRDDSVRLIAAVLAAPQDDGQVQLCATLLAEILATALPDDPRPMTQLVIEQCRTTLAALDTSAHLWITAVRNAALSDTQLLTVLPEHVPDILTWLAPNQLGPLVVAAAGAGITSAAKALDWCFTAEGQRRVRAIPGGPESIRHIRKLLQYRVEQTPALLPVLITDATRTRDTRDLCGAIDKISATGLRDHPAAIADLIRLRRDIIDDVRPDRRRHGHKLWRLLIERDLDGAPTPADLATALTNTKDAELISSILVFASMLAEHPAWNNMDASELQTVLEAYIYDGWRVRAGTSVAPETRRRVVNREALARQVLVLLLARVIPLPESANDRKEVARKAEGIVFDAGYDVSDRAQLPAFTRRPLPLAGSPTGWSSWTCSRRSTLCCVTFDASTGSTRARSNGGRRSPLSGST